jgi:hypothetical protein
MMYGKLRISNTNQNIDTYVGFLLLFQFFLSLKEGVLKTQDFQYPTFTKTPTLAFSFFVRVSPCANYKGNCFENSGFSTPNKTKTFRFLLPCSA